MRFDCSESRLVEVAKRSFASKDAAPNFLSQATTDVQRQITNVLIGHAELDSDHQNVIAWKICFLESADFLNDAALEHSDNAAAVVEVARQTIKFPSENCIGFAPFNSSKHFIENFATGCFGAF